MKIAIYGGSFNPAHTGHQLVAALVLATADVDELWFVPTYKHMLGKNLVDFNHRIEMTRIMARMFGHRASVSRAEQRLAQQPGFVGSRTIDLIRYLKSEWQNDKFRLVIGSDLEKQFKTWENSDEITESAPLIIVDRAGYQSSWEPGFILPDVSSTAVKAALQEGRNVSNLVPRDVMAYIKAHGLYGATTGIHDHEY